MTLDASRLHEALTLKGGAAAVLRAIRPDDRERLATAFAGLDPASVYLRYFTFKSELTDAELDRLTRPDFRERVVLVVTVGAGADERIVGSGGYVVLAGAAGGRRAEVAFAVEEDFHGLGIAGRLLAALVGIARADGIECLVADVLARNAPMLRVFERSGLVSAVTRGDDGVVRVTLTLAVTRPADASR